MAGIGFQLARLYKKKDLTSKISAIGYAGVIAAGPLILHFVMLEGITLISDYYRIGEELLEQVTAVIVYPMLFSILLSGIFSLALPRYISDQIEGETEENILPAFLGSSVAMILPGEVFFALFLLINKMAILNSFLLILLIGEMLLLWNEMTFLTAVKNYRIIFLSYLAGTVLCLIVLWFGFYLRFSALPLVLSSLCMGYGLSVLLNLWILLTSFSLPSSLSFRQFFCFAECFRTYPQLPVTSFFLYLGLYSHIFLMWLGKGAVEPVPGFWANSDYEFPAILAYLTTIVTMVSFLISVETKFYPEYKQYFDLLNKKGTLGELKATEELMRMVVYSEMRFTVIRQIIVTIFAIAVSSVLFANAPFYMTGDSIGYFRILCMGYGMFAIANTNLMILLYMADYSGTVMTTVIYGAASTVLSLISLWNDPVFYGIGYMIASFLFFLATTIRMDYLFGHLDKFTLIKYGKL